jgi:hypothetical protein
VLIIPDVPSGFWGGPDSASLAKSISFAPAEPCSHDARGSFAAGLRLTAARHGVKFKPMAHQFVAELVGDDFL